MRVTLHIGTHKTGTTFIQGQLDAQRDALAAQGVHYLGNGPNHSWINPVFSDHPEREHAAMRRGFAGESAAGEWARSMRERLASELAACAHPRVLVSGEDICRMEPSAIDRLLATIGQSASRIDVVCCIRDPIGYIASDTQEAIKGGMEWDEAMTSRAKANFRTALEAFTARLGTDAVRAYPFAPRSSDAIVADFARMTELTLSVLPGVGDRNRSLSAEAAWLLAEINRRWPLFDGDAANRERATIPASWLEGIGTTPFRLPRAHLERAVAAVAPDYDWLAEFTGEQWFDPVDASEHPALSPGLPDETRTLLSDFAGVLHLAARTLDQTVVSYLLQTARLEDALGRPDDARATLDRLDGYKPGEATGAHLRASINAREQGSRPQPAHCDA
jgi:hypothetical protein